MIARQRVSAEVVLRRAFDRVVLRHPVESLDRSLEIAAAQLLVGIREIDEFGFDEHSIAHRRAALGTESGSRVTDRSLTARRRANDHELLDARVGRAGEFTHGAHEIRRGRPVDRVQHERKPHAVRGPARCRRLVGLGEQPAPVLLPIAPLQPQSHVRGEPDLGIVEGSVQPVETRPRLLRAAEHEQPGQEIAPGVGAAVALAPAARDLEHLRVVPVELRYALLARERRIRPGIQLRGDAVEAARPVQSALPEEHVAGRIGVVAQFDRVIARRIREAREPPVHVRRGFVVSLLVDQPRTLFGIVVPTIRTLLKLCFRKLSALGRRPGERLKEPRSLRMSLEAAFQHFAKLALSRVVQEKEARGFEVHYGRGDLAAQHVAVQLRIRSVATGFVPARPNDIPVGPRWQIELVSAQKRRGRLRRHAHHSQRLAAGPALTLFQQRRGDCQPYRFGKGGVPLRGGQLLNHSQPGPGFERQDRGMAVQLGLQRFR